MIASRFARQFVVGLLVATIAGCNAASTGSIPAPATQGPTGPGGSVSATLPTLAAALPTLAPPPIDLTAVPARLHVDAAKGTSAWIGPAGGTLSASAADGTIYELNVPALAVGAPTPITMVPVASIDTLGLSGGLAGAVYLGPSGLKLTEPATLKITSTKTTPAGMRLVGFDVADDGIRTDLVPATTAGGVQTVIVTHFSSPGVGFGTTQDLALLAPAAPGPTPSAGTGGDMATALTELLALPTPWSLKDGQFAEAYLVILAAHVSIMQPELKTAATDADLLRAISDWRTFVLMLNLTAHEGDSSAALADGTEFTGVGSSYRNAFYDGQIHLGNLIAKAADGNKALCKHSHDLHALANMSFWAGLGRRYTPNWGDWTAESLGCAGIAIGQFNPASNLKAGVSDSVQIALVIEFSDGTQVPGDFSLALSGIGFSFASSGGANATAGEVASTVVTLGLTTSADPPYTLAATACWSLDGLPRDFCSGQLVQSFGPGATGASTGQGGNQPPPPTPASLGGSPGGLYLGQWTFCNPNLGVCYTQPASARISNQTAIGDWVIDVACVFWNTVAGSVGGTYRFRVLDLSSINAIGVPSPNNCSGTPTLKGSLVGTTLTFTLKGTSPVEYKFTGTKSPGT